MERWSERQIEWTPRWDHEPNSKVVIIYEDGPTGKRAKLFYDKLIHQLEDECAFSLQLWSFQVLAIPEIRKAAADSIAEADFVIFSLRGEAELPPRLRMCIETLPRQIFDRDPMLIALVDKTTARDDRNALTLAYLRDVAQTNRMLFLVTLFHSIRTRKDAHCEHSISRKRRATKRRNQIAFS